MLDICAHDMKCNFEFRLSIVYFANANTMSKNVSQMKFSFDDKFC